MSINSDKKFYWGAATSAHQVEGGNRNDWSEWEHANAERLAREAERLRRDKRFGKIFLDLIDHNNYISGAACDHYHRFEEDFDLARSLGHNAHRFSIEWSRIEPEKGKFDEREIAHYREVIRALKERGLEPFVTLWHWTVPLWFRDEGGWDNRRAAQYFERYVRKVAESCRDLGVQFWITLNEPEVYISHAYALGERPPQKRSLLRCVAVTRRFSRAHKKAYCAVKAVMPTAHVGIAKNNVHFEAAWWNPVARLLKLFADYFWNYYFLNRIRRYQDFIGLNYYFHNRITWWFGKNKNESVSDIGWGVYPEGLFRILKDLRRYKKPIYITENGLADRDDEKRSAFIRDHIIAMQEAMKSGVDVRGYFCWSLTDNFEWSKGFAPRFGLVAIDYKTLERRIRPSAHRYREIIEMDGFTKEG